MSDRRAYFRTRIMQLRETWRAIGLCPGCGEGRENPDREYCAICRMKATERMRSARCSVTVFTVEASRAHYST